jgi:hypothetical protein
MIRLTREAPRLILCAVALAGLAASARYAIDPPRVSRETVSGAVATPDRAAESYAVLFARLYLTWSAAQPDAGTQALSGYTGAGVEPGFGFVTPPSGEQRVLWAEVVQSREPARAKHVFTVAAQTDDDGILYLSVEIQRGREGVLAIAGYPAFVGPPSLGPATVAAGLPEVTEAALVTVVRRALANYLAGSAADLAADLSAGAHVSLPGMALSLESVTRLDWLPGGRSVLAVVQAQDTRGAQYTLGYELDVVRAQGRWEISAVQTDPDS